MHTIGVSFHSYSPKNIRNSHVILLCFFLIYLSSQVNSSGASHVKITIVPQVFLMFFKNQLFKKLKAKYFTEWVSETDFLYLHINSSQSNGCIKTLYSHILHQPYFIPKVLKGLYLLLSWNSPTLTNSKLDIFLNYIWGKWFLWASSNLVMKSLWMKLCFHPLENIIADYNIELKIDLTPPNEILLLPSLEHLIFT